MKLHKTREYFSPSSRSNSVIRNVRYGKKHIVSSHQTTSAQRDEVKMSSEILSGVVPMITKEIQNRQYGSTKIRNTVIRSTIFALYPTSNFNIGYSVVPKKLRNA
ncbi:unnamed protein product [Schistosoma intercalatum]|nr:unnamed protein product [Schistosoma intercalatum]CAH8576868.1 unnamed protein product [Schistosoma intercalatum]